jgi:hypothetical protein
MTNTNHTTAADRFNAVLAIKIEQGQEAVAKLAKDMAHDPLYGLAWAEGRAVEISESQLYLAVQQEAEGDVEALLPALKKAVEHAKSQLLSNSMRGGSSSQFSNAVEAAQREALSRFVRDNDGFITRLKRDGLL